MWEEGGGGVWIDNVANLTQRLTARPIISRLERNRITNVKAMIEF